MKNLFLSFSLFLALFCSCEQNKEATTLYLVRHAEKDLNDSTNNQPLSAEGVQRAEKLTNMMKDKNISAVFSTNFIRTIKTVEGSAEQAGLSVQLYDVRNPKPTLDAIKAGEHGKVVLMSGHSNTILPMIEQLGAKRPQNEINENEYDKLFKLSILKDSVLVDTIIF